jgi:hypothetical protein
LHKSPANGHMVLPAATKSSVVAWYETGT